MPIDIEPEFVERLRVVADRFSTRKEAATVGGVTMDAVIRYLRGENQPGFITMSRMCEKVDVSMHWLATGEGPQFLHETLQSHSVPSVPLQGMAESDTPGWYRPQPSKMQVTLDLPDPNAFATTVQGQNLIPEGLQPGFICICSPQLRPAKGDVVHLRRYDGLCSIRLFVAEENEWLVTKAYTDPDGKGVQRAFEDKVKRSAVKEIAPVVFIKRKV